MRFLIAIIIGLTLTACADGGPPPPPPNIGKFAPEVNPYPRYYMYIKGHIDPQFFKDHKVQFIADYSTYNDTCKYVVNSFEGVSSSRDQIVYISPTVDQSGEYEIEVPLDKYKNGYCNWNLVGIGFLIPNTDLNFTNAIALFNKDSKNNQYDIHDKIKCINNKCSRIVPSYLDTSYFLSTKTNYIFKLDVYGN